MYHRTFTLFQIIGRGNDQVAISSKFETREDIGESPVWAWLGWVTGGQGLATITHTHTHNQPLWRTQAHCGLSPPWVSSLWKLCHQAPLSRSTSTGPLEQWALASECHLEETPPPLCISCAVACLWVAWEEGTG